MTGVRTVSITKWHLRSHDFSGKFLFSLSLALVTVNWTKLQQQCIFPTMIWTRNRPWGVNTPKESADRERRCNQICLSTNREQEVDSRPLWPKLMFGTRHWIQNWSEFQKFGGWSEGSVLFVCRRWSTKTACVIATCKKAVRTAQFHWGLHACFSFSAKEIMGQLSDCQRNMIAAMQL